MSVVLLAIMSAIGLLLAPLLLAVALRAALIVIPAVLVALIILFAGLHRGSGDGPFTAARPQAQTIGIARPGPWSAGRF